MNALFGQLPKPMGAQVGFVVEGKHDSEPEELELEVAGSEGILERDVLRTAAGVEGELDGSGDLH